MEAKIARDGFAIREPSVNAEELGEVGVESDVRKQHVVEKLSFDRDKLVMHVDGQVHTFNLSKISKRLANASAVERERFEISPSGYGIHWPLIDEDLSIDGLLGIRHSPRKTNEPIPA